MKAPAGAIVRIYLDLVARVGTGDIIETQSGRRYRVLGVRVQERGKHAGRQHLSCVVLGPDELTYEGMTPDHPSIPTVHKIRWYPRGRRSR